MVSSSVGRDRADAIWIVLVAAASVLFSLAFACATPFAAIAAIAATQMDRRAGVYTVLLAWAGNQAIGYGVLHYPHHTSSYEWGLAIGFAAVLALVAARTVAATLTGLAAVTASALVAFATYEGVLFATSLVLHSGSGAFTLAIVARIATIDAVALIGLISLHRACLLIGVPVPNARALAP